MVLTLIAKSFMFSYKTAAIYFAEFFVYFVKMIKILRLS